MRGRRKLTPLTVFNLLLDIEAGINMKVIAAKYQVTYSQVTWYRRQYFTLQYVRKPVEWPYIGKVPHYLRRKITHQ